MIELWPATADDLDAAIDSAVEAHVATAAAGDVIHMPELLQALGFTREKRRARKACGIRPHGAVRAALYRLGWIQCARAAGEPHLGPRRFARSAEPAACVRDALVRDLSAMAAQDSSLTAITVGRALVALGLGYLNDWRRRQLVREALQALGWRPAPDSQLIFTRPLSAAFDAARASHCSTHQDAGAPPESPALQAASVSVNEGRLGKELAASAAVGIV